MFIPDAKVRSGVMNGNSFFEANKLWQFLLAVFFAILGGMARLLNLKDKGRLTLRTILAEFVVAGFTGMMVYLLASELGLSGNWIGIMCGAAGYGGVKVVMAIIFGVIDRTLKIDSKSARQEEGE